VLTMVKRIRGRRLQRIRARLLRGQPLCVRCLEVGLVKGATQIDHKIPLFQGGEDTDENRQPLCDDCHHAKSMQERGCVKTGANVAGLPINPSHHWNAA